MISCARATRGLADCPCLNKITVIGIGCCHIKAYAISFTLAFFRRSKRIQHMNLSSPGMLPKRTMINNHCDIFLRIT